MELGDKSLDFRAALKSEPSRLYKNIVVSLVAANIAIGAIHSVQDLEKDAYKQTKARIEEHGIETVMATDNYINSNLKGAFGFLYGWTQDARERAYREHGQ